MAGDFYVVVLQRLGSEWDSMFACRSEKEADCIQLAIRLKEIIFNATAGERVVLESPDQKFISVITPTDGPVRIEVGR